MTDWGGLVDDDPVGVASSRLLAAGLPLAERRQALRVLGALLDDAGPGGRLPANPLTFLGLVSRLHIPLEDVLRHRRWLEAVGALERDVRGWVVTGAEHHLSSAVSTVDALDCIAAVLGDRGPELATVTPLRRPATTKRVGGTGDGWGRRLRPSVTFAGLSVAAVVIWVLALVPPAPQQVQGVASDRALEAAPPPLAPVLSAPRAAREAAPRREAPAAPQAGRQAEVPVAAKAEARTVCPVGVPAVVIQALDGPKAVEDLGSALTEVPSVTVAGITTNQSGASVTLESFAIVVDTGSERLTVSGLAKPVTLEPGASAPWRAVVPVPSKPVTTVTAAAQGLTWDWADPALASACRS